MENAYVAPSRVREAALLMCRTSHSNDALLWGDEPAVHALTDFQQEYPITVHAGRSVHEALEDMIRLGVHALLVTRPDDDGVEEQVLGLVTALDMTRSGAIRRRMAGCSEAQPFVSVETVMAAWDDLSLVNYESLLTLSALELYERFQGTGVTHLLVIEHAVDGSTLARGMISRAGIARRLRRLPAAGSAHGSAACTARAERRWEDACAY